MKLRDVLDFFKYCFFNRSTKDRKHTVFVKKKEVERFSHSMFKL